ncbi:hypothetical protein AB0P17_36420 [Streptomyces sp. NPDC088124]|uniref:hypothetical protein n=1 Tax=Streptomyces sp. NPDC088124 TaxID=3154654 RepID=UPI00342298B7
METTRPQRVRVPWRVVTSSHYGDAALAVYVKVAGLGLRREGCEAGVRYLSGLLGISRSSVERSLTQLMRPAPDDDVVEMVSYRRTLPGGRGTTAVRRVRATARREAFVWVPTTAPESLNPRQLRAYTAISYAVATGHPLSLAELGDILRHRSGKRCGQPLSDTAVRRILTGLEDLGWITVDRRAGYQGRHAYTVHECPAQLPLAAADLADGSGADLADGSLATEEVPTTDSPDDDAAAGGFIRRRRDQVVERGPVEDHVPAVFRRPYTGPELTLAPRIWEVLSPVQVLTAGLTQWQAREVGREVGRQLDQGCEPERLRARLTARYASTEPVRSPYGWLTKVALVRGGCGLDACESGIIWRTGHRCDVCADLRAARHRPPPPAEPAAPPGPAPAQWHECDDCGAPAREPLPGGLCRTCRPRTPARSPA